MPRFFIKLSYLGNAYNGWQKQKNSTQTVQQCIESALQTVLREQLLLTGCGRTDTGVHARNYWAHFDCNNTALKTHCSAIVHKLNSVLPKSIVIHSIYNVLDTAHARFDALSRSYEYLIIRKPDPFYHSRAWFIHGELDTHAMHQATTQLMGKQDFKSFCKSHGQQKTTLCSVSSAVWDFSNPDLWTFTISANRFLRGMVRGLVGTLVQIGQHKRPDSDMLRILQAADRRISGPQAPAEGLYFTGAEYPNTLFIEK